MPPFEVINLESGRPSLEEARRRLGAALDRARSRRCAVLKLIHGYGSSGAGGVLRDGIQASLRKRRKKGEIRAVIYGQNWSIFDDLTREVLEACPELRRDADLDRGNEGISIAWLPADPSG